MALPIEQLAARIATEVTRQTPSGLHRFTTGTSHYVFEAFFADRCPLVVRIGGRAARTAMEGAIHLSGVLKPLGVPLPEILGSDTNAELPWLALQRLPGTDLGTVISDLSDAQLGQIAMHVSRAQAITASTISAGRYGYAARPDEAPYSVWSQVLEANLNRSRRRIISARLFDPAMVDVVQAAVTSRRSEIDRMEPIPFLHDTTTKNVLITEERTFSGIVDVDDLCFGDPRYPAALTLAALLAYGGPIGYVSAWLQHAEQPDDSLFRLYVSVFLLDLMAEQGQVLNGNERLPTPLERASLMQVLQNNLEAST